MGPLVVRLALFSSLLVAACGGVAMDSFHDDDAGTGGASNGGHPGGGAPGSGGKVSSGAVPGAGGKVGGGAVPGAGGKVGGGGAIGSGGIVGAGGAIGVAGAPCCMAAALCNSGDVQVGGPCPPDTSCYQVNVCCHTIWCRRDPTCTQKIDPCLPGDIQLDAPLCVPAPGGGCSTCPPGGSCYQRTICGNVVSCFSPAVQDGGAPVACGGPPPRGVHYVSTSLQQCALIDYACPTGTTGYSDGCGCGCRQSTSCPDYVNCAPMIPPAPTNPLCSDGSGCPYSPRVY